MTNKEGGHRTQRKQRYKDTGEGQGRHRPRHSNSTNRRYTPIKIYSDGEVHWHTHTHTHTHRSRALKITHQHHTTLLSTLRLMHLTCRTMRRQLHWTLNIAAEFKQKSNNVWKRAVLLIACSKQTCYSVVRGGVNTREMETKRDLIQWNVRMDWMFNSRRLNSRPPSHPLSHFHWLTIVPTDVGDIRVDNL